MTSGLWREEAENLGEGPPTALKVPRHPPTTGVRALSSRPHVQAGTLFSQMLNAAAVHAALLCHKDGLDRPPWRGRADLSQGLGQCWPPGQPVSVPYPNPRHRSGMQKEQRGPGIWSSVELGSKPSSSARLLCCVAVTESLNSSGPWFLHPQNGSTNCFSFSRPT